jgi:hypothetical protein
MADGNLTALIDRIEEQLQNASANEAKLRRA